MTLCPETTKRRTQASDMGSSYNMVVSGNKAINNMGTHMWQKNSEFHDFRAYMCKQLQLPEYVGCSLMYVSRFPDLKGIQGRMHNTL